MITKEHRACVKEMTVQRGRSYMCSQHTTEKSEVRNIRPELVIYRFTRS
jgi:thiamine phosphate synthase YjbQ (UPF0047 family)